MTKNNTESHSVTKGTQVRGDSRYYSSIVIGMPCHRDTPALTAR